MESIKQILMNRDGMSAEEAEALIEEAKDQMGQYLEEGDQESAYEVCSEYFGLEPDYIMELFD